MEITEERMRIRVKKRKEMWLIAFVFMLALYTYPVHSFYALPQPEEEQYTGQLPEFSIYRLLKIALQPVGKTMYIWGGGWNEEDTAAGIEAVSLGLSPNWEKYSQKQNRHYDYTATRYQIHDGLDCSGYVGWVIYNLLHTIDGIEGEGYVMKARKMAKTFAEKGWGEYIPAGKIKDYKAGDIMSSKTHVYLVIGTCEDGSIVVAHASPPGVQINGTVCRNGSRNSQAAELADYYMNKYYPQWYAKYKPEVKEISYLTNYHQMRWHTEDNFWLKDEEGLRNMKADQVLQKILGE